MKCMRNFWPRLPPPGPGFTSWAELASQPLPKREWVIDKRIPCGLVSNSVGEHLSRRHLDGGGPECRGFQSAVAHELFSDSVVKVLLADSSIRALPMPAVRCFYIPHNLIPNIVHIRFF